MAATPATPSIPPLLHERYPLPATLRDGRTVQLRVMSGEDRDQVLAFARSLPPDDLLFLRANITDPAVIDEWLADLQAGRTITLLAYDGDTLVGEGDLYHSATTWMRHLGEIRLLLSPSVRGQGLARLLAEEIFVIAKALNLQILVAQMTLDQAAAQTIFRRLGFQREAVLLDYVIDAEGKTRDLVIATRRL